MSSYKCSAICRNETGIVKLWTVLKWCRLQWPLDERFKTAVKAWICYQIVVLRQHFLGLDTQSRVEIMLVSCVFWIANGCSACRSQVKIMFFTLKQLFPSFTVIKNVLFLRSPFFFHYFSSFFSVSDGKKLTCFNSETNDLDQQTACRAPVWWSKYTTLVEDTLI